MSDMISIQVTVPRAGAEEIRALAASQRHEYRNYKSGHKLKFISLKFKTRPNDDHLTVVKEIIGLSYRPGLQVWAGSVSFDNFEDAVLFADLNENVTIYSFEPV